MALVAKYVETPFSSSTSRSMTNWQGRRGLGHFEEFEKKRFKILSSYLHPLAFNFSTILVFSCKAASGQEFPNTNVSTCMLGR